MTVKIGLVYNVKNKPTIHIHIKISNNIDAKNSGLYFPTPRSVLVCTETTVPILKSYLELSSTEIHKFFVEFSVTCPLLYATR